MRRGRKQQNAATAQDRQILDPQASNTPRFAYFSAALMIFCLKSARNCPIPLLAEDKLRCRCHFITERHSHILFVLDVYFLPSGCLTNTCFAGHYLPPIRNDLFEVEWVVSSILEVLDALHRDFHHTIPRLRIDLGETRPLFPGRPEKRLGCLVLFLV